MGSTRMFWFLVFTLTLIFNTPTEARHGKHIPSAVVVGTVYCDTCFQQDFSTSSHFITGATVAVKCGADDSSKTGFYKEVKTNEQGVFKVHLPIAVTKHVKSIKGCSVKLISSSEPFCAVASSATTSSLHLKSRKEGTHIFSAGFFTFKPLKQPELCNQKPSQKLSSIKAFFPSPQIPNFPPITQTPILPNLPPKTQNPTLPSLPPITPIPQFPTLPPFLNLPPLPALPNLPSMPNLPPLPNLGQQPNIPLQPKAGDSLSLKSSPTSDQGRVKPTFFFPPIFPSPPPGVVVPLPPNPLMPPPLLPPVPGLTPPPPTTNLPPLFPPIPGLTPPSPPPRFPFPPVVPGFPGFPGIPPASTSQKNSP